jgi:hypothetical protein
VQATLRESVSLLLLKLMEDKSLLRFEEGATLVKAVNVLMLKILEARCGGGWVVVLGGWWCCWVVSAGSMPVQAIWSPSAWLGRGAPKEAADIF